MWEHELTCTHTHRVGGGGRRGGEGGEGGQGDLHTSREP